jgi:hypothetical protein
MPEHKRWGKKNFHWEAAFIYVKISARTSHMTSAIKKENKNDVIQAQYIIRIIYNDYFGLLSILLLLHHDIDKKEKIQQE